MKPYRGFYLLRWIRLFIQLAETIIGIFTLAFYYPNWSFKFIGWEMKRAVRLKKVRNE